MQCGTALGKLWFKDQAAVTFQTSFPDYFPALVTHISLKPGASRSLKTIGLRDQSPGFSSGEC